MSTMAVRREPWMDEMRNAISANFDRLVFDIYFVRFRESASIHAVHRYLVKTRGEDAPSRPTVHRAVKRLEVLAPKFRR